jgi:hypothetical protein
MKQPFSEEILSAYVDDELPAQERAAVERWLEEDPEARNKLDEFRRLSGLFDDLPRSEVPPEFPTNVLQLAERQMLLAEARPAKSRNVLRRWAFAGGSSIAAAVVLGLALHLYQPIDPAQPPENRIDGRAMPAQGPVLAGGSRSMKETDIRDLGRESSGGELPELRGPLPANEPGAGPAAPASGRAPRANARRGKAVTEQDALEAIADVSPDQQDQIDKAMEEIGKTPEEKDLVAVVKFRCVVDRAQGMVLVQQVLAESQIPLEEDITEERGTPEFKIAAKPALRGASENEALYVVAEPEQLVAAFATILARHKIASGLEVADPIEVAALDEDSKKRLEQVERDVISNLAPAKPAVADDVRRADDATPAAEGKLDKKPESEPPAAVAQKKVSPKGEAVTRGQQKSADAKQNTPAERVNENREPALGDAEVNQASAWQGRQTVVNYRQQAASDRGRAGLAGKDSTASKSASRSQAIQNQKKEQPPRDEDGDASDHAPALVRVLIVLEESAR